MSDSVRASVRERRIEARDGLRLRVVERHPDARDRAPLLLLHGFTGSVEAWGTGLLDGLAGRRTPRARGAAPRGPTRAAEVARVEGRAPLAGPIPRRVIALDLPGHGGSDVPSDRVRYALPRVLDDLEDVLDALGVERAVWVGYSMGGRVALGGAVLRPARVEALILESAAPGLADAEARRARREADEARAGRLEEEGLEAFVDRWMALPLFESQRSLPDEVRDRERRRRLACDSRGLAATLRGLGTGSQPSFWEDLPEVRIPVLLLTGGLDPKFETIADRMASALPSARRRSISGAGHAVHLEAQGAWLEAVEGFLEAMERG